MLKVLGPIITVGTAGTASQRGRRGRVLAALAAHAGHPVSVDALVESVWDGSPPRTARNAIQVHISQIRALGVPVETTSDAYLMHAKSEVLDSVGFERLVERAMACDEPTERATKLTAALDMWRGRAFHPFEDLDIVRPAATYLDQLRLDVEDLLIDAQLESRFDLGLVERIRKLVDEAPLREHRWAQLMLGLYRAGRQADALRGFREASRVLGEELGIVPGLKLRTLEERILLQDPMLDRSPFQPVDLPEWPTALVGREDALSELVTLVTRHRLVTLVGLGGVGKTRVVAETARRLAARYRDGLIYVDLTSLSRSGDVARFFGEKAGVEDGHGSARTALRDRQVLVVIDNCDHVTEGVRELIEKVLLPSPAVQILATSRVPLGVYGETVQRLNQLDREDALALFERTAQRWQPGFSLYGENRNIAEEVCRIVGGIPLLLELMASKVADRSLSTLRNQLINTEYGLATEEAVEATIGWALAQLSDTARSAAAALSVFRGGWTAANGTVVLDKLGAAEPADILAVLTRSSLIWFSPGDDRYGMLEPVRMAAQRLDPTTVALARQIHTGLFVSQALEALPYLSGYGQHEWLDILEAEQHNLRAVVDRALAENNPEILPALGSLGFLWFRRFRQGEAAAWFDRVEAAFDLTAERQPLAAIQSAHAAMWAGDPETASDRIDRIEPLVMASEAPFLIGRLHHSRGNIIAWGYGTPRESLQHFERATGVLAPSGDPLAVVATLSEAYMAVRSGNADHADELVPLITHLSTELAPAFGSMGEDQIRGLAALHGGDMAECTRLLTRSIHKLEELGLTALRGPLLVPLAWSHLLAGNIGESRSVALEAHTSVVAENGGWRIGEVSAVLGGVSLAEGNMVAAQRWFTLAFESALPAPEADILVWAGAGLLAAADWRSDARRIEFASASRRFAVDSGVMIPGSVQAFLGVAEPEPGPSAVTARDLNLLRKGGIDA